MCMMRVRTSSAKVFDIAASMIIPINVWSVFEYSVAVPGGKFGGWAVDTATSSLGVHSYRDHRRDTAATQLRILGEVEQTTLVCQELADRSGAIRHNARQPVFDRVLERQHAHLVQLHHAHRRGEQGLRQAASAGHGHPSSSACPTSEIGHACGSTSVWSIATEDEDDTQHAGHEGVELGLQLW